MIYLDYNATTPIDPEVANAMQPYINSIFGNPSSMHDYGTTAKKAVENARAQVAKLINCDLDEIIFTSGGTESNNMAIQGIAKSMRSKGRHIITSSIEHPAVGEVCSDLEESGYEISRIEVDEFGTIDPEAIKNAIRPDTILITIMHANNEVGTIQEIAKIGEIAKKNGIVFHSDAAQSLGKIPVDVRAMQVDLLSIAGHKIYAPKGIGALYIKRGTTVAKLMHGANHEQNLRPGTENVIEIVGLGQACELAGRELMNYATHTSSLRDLLFENIKGKIPAVKRNGHPELVLPNTLSLSFPNIEANTLLSRLDGIAASAGAACHAEHIDVSTVLKALDLPLRYAMGTIRLSLGKNTSRSDILKASEMIVDVVRELSNGTPNEITENENVKLTQYTHGLGCACKIEPRKLEEILKQLPKGVDPNVMVGVNTSDDASIYKLTDELAIVQSLDFFTPIVDDAYDFGAIAAANALSDIYAMGAKALYAQNIVAFPENTLPMTVLEAILRGAADKAREAGIDIIGGHSIEDPEPKFGMVITGMIHPEKYISNASAKPGDLLILTKPLGLGILSTALKRGMLNKSEQQKITKIMSTLNKNAAEIMTKYKVNACTDVTGFGLLGHLKEMSAGSGCDVEIKLKEIPIIDRVRDLAAAGVIPGGSLENLEHMQNWVHFNQISGIDQKILADAQTSGGLLIAIEENDAPLCLLELQQAGIIDARIIGQFKNQGKGEIFVH